MKITLSIPFILISLLLLGFTSSNSSSSLIQKDSRLLAVGWFALSAEKEACYLQAYKLATWELEKIEKKQTNRKTKPLAIVTDLDETVLDNSPWQAKVVLEEKDHPDYWNEWEQKANANAFPGAVSFFQKAKALGIPVFYISNRNVQNLGGTIQNLQKLGLPFADSGHVLLKTTTSNKIERRAKITKKYELAMLLGDNLADFDGIWEDASVESRLASVSKFEKVWGKKFIIFPNPMYGNWKEAIFDYKRSKDPQIIDSTWKSALNRFVAKHW